jgi:hypothetical protein
MLNIKINKFYIMDLLKLPNILFIKGVFKSDFSNVEEIIYEEKNQIKHSTIPTRFEQVDTWNSQHIHHSIKCATCSNIITEDFVFIPSSMERVNDIKYWIPLNTCRFDTFQCAAFHINYFVNNDPRYKLLLANLFKFWKNETVSELEISIPYWRIDEYGGDITRTEFERINEYNLKKYIISFKHEDTFSPSG